MNQAKFGQLIKKIRKENNLTQKELADKYNITYQAVSKWENGINMPDMALIKQISQDFNISLEELFGSEYKPYKKPKYMYIIIGVLIIITISIVAVIAFKDNGFEFKTLSSNCSNFTISGSISYNAKKSAIYITNIEYCGGDTLEEYSNIECILYEKDETSEHRISSYKYDNKKKINLETFLKDVTLTVNDYDKKCQQYDEDSLYLIINATDDNEKTVTYKIPLKFDESCSH